MEAIRLQKCISSSENENYNENDDDDTNGVVDVVAAAERCDTTNPLESCSLSCSRSLARSLCSAAGCLDGCLSLDKIVNNNNNNTTTTNAAKASASDDSGATRSSRSNQSQANAPAAAQQRRRRQPEPPSSHAHRSQARFTPIVHMRATAQRAPSRKLACSSWSAAAAAADNWRAGCHGANIGN